MRVTNLTLTEQTLLRIAAALEKLAAASLPQAPDHRFPIGDYGDFDWGKIGATVIRGDRTGPGVVEWNGYTFVRRVAESAKYGKAIIFSRNAGMDEDGAQYHVLVKFTDSLTVNELPDSISRVAGTPRPARGRVNGATATVAAAAPADPSYPAHQETDWEQEAYHAADPLLFDTAVARLLPTFFDSSQKVATTRTFLFTDEYDITLAPAMLKAIKAYTDKRTELDAKRYTKMDSHNNAKAVGVATYADERRKALA